MNYKKPIDTHASPCLNVASVSNSNHYTNMTTQATATVNDSNLLPVKLSVNWNGKIQLIVSVFNGWDDVRELTAKVLTLPNDSRSYVFQGWDSDRNLAYFAPGTVATVR